MTPQERNKIRELAAGKHKGNLDAAVCDWLGLSLEFKHNGGKVPNGNAGAVYNIKDELDKYAESDADEAKAAAAAAGTSADGKTDAGGSDKTEGE